MSLKYLLPPNFAAAVPNECFLECLYGFSTFHDESKPLPYECNRYAFDYVFDATATQRAVYENTTKFLIQVREVGYDEP